VDGSIILHWDIFLYGILGHYHKWFIEKPERNLGGVDTNMAGWYFIKKTGMVKFVEIGNK
uniref:hypothetical protein n=1 Tax=Ruminococcus sp. Marseille-P328 TaxID=1816688 RepID=UPI003565C754